MKRERALKITYVIIELLLLLGAKYAEIKSPGQWESILKYAAIVINALMAVFFFFKNHFKGNGLLIMGLLMTAVGDWFLTYKGDEEYYLWGIAAFCMVQLLYLFYIRPNRSSLFYTVGLYGAGLLALMIAKQLTLVTALGWLDIVLIITNTINSWRNSSIPLLFKTGITLFLGCDVSLMLSFITPVPFKSVAFWLVWVFYAPSQVLITLAAIQKSN